MSRLRIVLLPTVLLLGASAGFAPTPAAAATCSDYSNQAEAQRAADTIDADGDGKYCESLPCPCSSAKGGGGGGGSTKKKKKSKPTFTYYGRVEDVIDGDTIKVEIRNRVKTVRLIGIDTPESHKPGVDLECGAKEAESATWDWAFPDATDDDGDGLYDGGETGRRVTLRTDNTQDKTDRYGRLLAYVSHGNRNLAKTVIRAGWGKVYVYNHHPFKRVRAFRAAEGSAKRNVRGVWGQCDGDFHSEQ